MLWALTLAVLVDVTSAYAAPLDGDESFVFFWFGDWDVDYADVS
jgi:hypothetical protein